mgnify:FL=1
MPFEKPSLGCSQLQLVLVDVGAEEVVDVPKRKREQLPNSWVKSSHIEVNKKAHEACGPP